MILDIITLIIIIIFMIIGLKKGAAKIFGSFFSVLISFAASVVLSHLLASIIYSTFIQAAIIKNINSVANDVGLVTASQKASELFSAFPAFVSNILAYFNVNEGVIADLFNTSAINNIESAFMAPVVAVISLILFLILFGFILFITKKLINLIVKIFRLPVIRILDSIVGMCIGVVEGALIIYILAMLISIIIPFTSGELYILNEKYINDSYVFSLIYNGNIVSDIQNFVFSISR